VSDHVQSPAPSVKGLADHCVPMETRTTRRG
jgi:hypothetical protein